MPVLDWTLPRRRKQGGGGSTKVYKVDVISMTEDDSFTEMPTRPGYGTLRKIKSLNDLLEEEGADSDNESIKDDSEPSKQQQKPELEQKQSPTSNNWTANYLSQRSKKPVERMIVSGFSTLSRRAGGGNIKVLVCVRMHQPSVPLLSISLSQDPLAHKETDTTKPQAASCHCYVQQPD